MKAIQFKTLLKVISCLGLFVLVSCNQYEPNTKVSLESSDINEDYSGFTYTAVETTAKSKTGMVPADLKIIKTADVKYKVNNVELATKQIKLFTMQLNAYISDLRFQNNLYNIENRFTIKVPQNYFEELMDSINNVAAFIEFENIATKDVTEEYLDLETRLKTKKEVRARYEDILRSKAKTVEEVLATEEKIRLIQEEIESSQGRLKYLTNKVAYSTIQVNLYEEVTYKEEPISYTKSFLSKTKEGLTFGWNLIESIVLAIIYVWPIMLLGTVAFLWLRKRNAKK
jgi:hypothetical protein